MNILITGSAGFIGSHIADRLIEQDHLVIGLDDLSSGKLAHVNEQMAFFQLDLSQTETLFERYEIDLVIHCAAQTNVRASIEDPTFDAMENIFGSLSVLEAMKKFGCKRIIFLSSGGALYGETSDRPTLESHPINPLSPYGIAKYSIENYLNFYEKIHRFEPTILRLANVYGPRNEKGIINLAINKSKKGEKLEVYGGHQTRDYIHVSDIVSAIECVINKKALGIYNVGTGCETSVIGVLKLTGIDKALVDEQPFKKGELQYSSLDSTKLQDLGWEPKIWRDKGIDSLR